MLLQVIQLDLEPAGVAGVVGIEQGDVLPGGLEHASIVGSTDTPIDLPERA